jgi:hypothetical protein
MSPENPYLRMAATLKSLFWLAARARKFPEEDLLDAVNEAEGGWTGCERLARTLSVGRGIPFGAFDRALRKANKIRVELEQIALGNPDYPFNALHRRFPEMERRLEALGATFAGGDPLPTARQGKRQRLSGEEAEVLVDEYLRRHKARASKGEVSIREVVQETGVPQGSVAGTDAWKALQGRLEKLDLSKRPRPRKAVAFSPGMEATVADPDQAVRELLAEQQSDYEPSPFEEGRRPPVRCRKKF